MCTILFSWKQHEKYPLVLLANRDEFYERETRTAHWWDDHPDVLGGRDLRAGGTWMGVNRKGKFAAVTNYRKFPVEHTFSTSRGNLVRNFLITDVRPDEYFDWLVSNSMDFEGFNLLFGNTDVLYYFSNRGDGRKLNAGTYGLSNHLLDTPWFKVQRGKELFVKSLDRGLKDHEIFFDLLKDNQPAPDDQLPETGIGPERERMLSSIFIESKHYGTRLSTILIYHSDGQMEFIEQSYVPFSQNRASFQLKQLQDLI